MEKQKIIDFMIHSPHKLGHLLGFTRLTELHGEWISKMILSNEDITLQAHRGSYKTTCVSIALAEIVILYPQKTTMFLRKTDTDVKEIIKQVAKILESETMQYLVMQLYDTELIMVTRTYSEIDTNLHYGAKGTPQLYCSGIGGSLTGKHFDKIFTDDIVNVKDRVSRAERENTKLAYQELQNIKNRGGNIFNTGTPWHKDDCFAIMPNPKRYDCYSTGLISDDELKKIKSSMTSSLFAANYELKHIADDDIIFASPNVSATLSDVEQGISHIDAAYGGADFTAYTAALKKDGKFYIYGRLFPKHIDDILPEIFKIHDSLNLGKFYVEDNGDKGFLARDIRKNGYRCIRYHENMNKYLKITSFLKFEWENVVFVSQTDPEYINQICDYNENAEHDDAPDSLASVIRILQKKKDMGGQELTEIEKYFL